MNLPAYQDFINASDNKKLLLLELGVGYNTSVIIRYPFEKITQSYEHAKLIRINLNYAGVPKEIEEKSIEIAADIGKTLADILEIHHVSYKEVT